MFESDRGNCDWIRNLNIQLNLKRLSKKRRKYMYPLLSNKYQNSVAKHFFSFLLHLFHMFCKISVNWLFVAKYIHHSVKNGFYVKVVHINIRNERFELQAAWIDINNEMKHNILLFMNNCFSKVYSCIFNKKMLIYVKWFNFLQKFPCLVFLALL